MKINIDCKFQKDKDLKIIAIFLFSIILCELYLIKVPSENEIVEDPLTVKREVTENIGEIREKIISKNFDIKSINKQENSYVVELNIQGKVDDFLQKAKDLNDFFMEDYRFFIESDLVIGKITINYSS